jgi:hypothetical protein
MLGKAPAVAEQRCDLATALLKNVSSSRNTPAPASTTPGPDSVDIIAVKVEHGRVCPVVAGDASWSRHRRASSSIRGRRVRRG